MANIRVDPEDLFFGNFKEAFRKKKPKFKIDEAQGSSTASFG